MQGENKNEKQGENKNEKDPLVQLDNSGQVYYSSGSSIRLDKGALGALVCKRCGLSKPFEQMRWNDKLKIFICLDCKAQDGDSPAV